MKSLEKDRAHRYETANGLAEDVRRHLEREPVLARGASTTYRLHKLLRRHRVQAFALLSMWNRDRLRLVEAEGFRHRGILSHAREQYAKADREAALETLKPVLRSTSHVSTAISIKPHPAPFSSNEIITQVVRQNSSEHLCVLSPSTDNHHSSFPPPTPGRYRICRVGLLKSP